jgi:hypothetical protein
MTIRAGAQSNRHRDSGSRAGARPSPCLRGSSGRSCTVQRLNARSVADHMFRNYDGVLKTDGGVGDMSIYDPRVWPRSAETAMAARIGEATAQLGSAGRTLLQG